MATLVPKHVEFRERLSVLPPFSQLAADELSGSNADLPAHRGVVTAAAADRNLECDGQIEYSVNKLVTTLAKGEALH